LNKQAIHNPKGFTLVEILMAVLIFSIIITALFSSFAAFIVSSESVKQELTHNEKIKNVFKRTRMDLEALYVLHPPRYKRPQFNSDPDPYRFLGKENQMGQVSASSMAFGSLAHARTGLDNRMGVARIVYYLRENENNTYDLCRADALPPFPEDIVSCYDPVLCRDVSGFEVIYRDNNGNDHRYWDSESEEFNYSFPARVDLKITFGIEGKRRTFEIFISPGTGREPID